MMLTRHLVLGRLSLVEIHLYSVRFRKRTLPKEPQIRRG